MAVKQATKTAETPVDTNTQTPDIAQIPAEASAPTSTATGADGAASGATGAKRGPKGPRTSAPYTWSREMDAELADILKAEKRPNEVRTASVVAYELNKTDAFSTNPVSAQQVNSHVEALRTQLPKNGLTVPSWLALDTVKRQALDAGLWGSLVG